MLENAALPLVKLLVMDVDGTLTDGGVYFDADGGEMKRFNIHDGLGIVLARHADLQMGWITGRTSPIVERRARELGVTLLAQGVRDKAAALTAMALRAVVPLAETAFFGDDLNDIPAMRVAGTVLCPADAAPEVRALAHYITPRSGGDGAGRDAIEILLRARGDYETAVDAYLASLTAATKGPLQ